MAPLAPVRNTRMVLSFRLLCRFGDERERREGTAIRQPLAAAQANLDEGARDPDSGVTRGETA